MGGSGDYISREPVEQIIAAKCGECADVCLEFDGIQPDCNQCLLHGVLKELATIPAADVVPVVHARWESAAGKRARFCSRCFHDEPYKFADEDADVYAFCPNCGADMRPKEE